MLYIDIHTHERRGNMLPPGGNMFLPGGNVLSPGGSRKPLKILTCEELKTFSAASVVAPQTEDMCLAVVNCNERLEVSVGRCVSLGIHPWWVDADWKTLFERMRQRVRAADVLFVGECGLDKVRGGNWSAQLVCFEAQVELAEQMGKPLLIHCVKAYDEVLRVCRTTRVRRIIHGFRGKPQLAQGLLNRGFDLSFGFRFNPDSLRLAYEHRRMWLETDDASDGDIRDVYALACKSLSMSPTDLELPGMCFS